MSDRDVKQIWEAVVSERDHDEPAWPPEPSKEWYEIIGLNEREARPISTSDMSKMVDYFKTLPEDRYNVILEELRKLNSMGYEDGPLYAQKLGFDGSFSQDDFKNLHNYLLIHINPSAGEEYLQQQYKSR